MQLFVREKQFYRSLVMTALPIAFQNLINFGVSVADTVMIGMLSEVHLSAVALANQVGFIFMLFTFGLGGGCNVMLAQFWGKRDTESMHKVLAIMYRLLLGGGILFTVIALCFPMQAMSVFSTDSAVIAEGAKFLRIVGFSYLVAGFNNVTVITLRSVGSVVVSVVMSFTGLLTNVFLNAMLIFGIGVFPRMEVQGAAIATCIARLAELLVVVIYMVFFEKQINFRIRSLFLRRMGIFKEFFRTAMPVVGNEILWSFGMTAIAAIIGRMGTEFTAANSICSVLSQLVTIFIFGVGNGSAVIIGNTIGRGEYEKAKDYARTLLAISVLLGIFASALVLVLRAPVVSIYNVSDLARTYASQIIYVYAAVVIGQSFAAVSLLGILRGGGDTFFALVMDLVFMWCICIPLGALAGLKLGLSVPLVYAIIKSDEILKALLGIYRVRSGKWVIDVTRRV